MSIRSQARADFKTNLTNDGDAVKLTSPTAVVYNVVGKVARIEAGIDPDTGQQFYEPKTAVTVSLADLGGVEPTTDSWKIETTDSEGNAIETMSIERRLDRTIGFVTFIFEEFTE